MTAQLDLLTPLARGLRKRDKSASEHEAEILRCIPIMRRLALERGEVALDDLREALGWLTSKGRSLSWMGCIPERSGLVKVGMRRSRLASSNGNWLLTWSLPR